VNPRPVNGRTRPFSERSEIPTNPHLAGALLGAGLMRPLVLCLGGLALFVGACGSRAQPAQGPDPEYSDQEEYANTPTAGPGSESSSGYYGAGSSGTPEHRPAQPSARP